MRLRFGANFLGSGTTGFTWARDLALGEGEALTGRPLAEASDMAHNFVAPMDLTATALTESEPAPTEAIALMARLFIPLRAYILMGDLGWLRQTRRNCVLTHLGKRPFGQA